ncbi:UDP-N-acetylmuramoyl-tripeptide--D-alanyl-D-alanine ligase [Candidatus Poriferisocius sp.]|uniref:UDP-N-acetylmuramoyl-tripeptide--D-alanyl-D- alanine ligase n=1 Tax=Candidatus Poriferisocius sp. TaxID=3101276 RepID=UPI003B013815
MKLSASEVALAVGGQLVGPDVVMAGASIDSRTVIPGELFVPVVAERDGHDFIDHAVAAGATAYLTSKSPQGGTAVVVDDTAKALAELGRHARNQFDGPVVGITGSVGKTSVKDMAAAAIGADRPTHASPMSFNNELGVPLTLVNRPEGAEVVVVEMGARGVGHIAWLCTLGRPSVGVVTAVGAAHTELFGTVEAVAEAKGELVEALDRSGVAVLNADQPLVAAMAERTEADVLTFGRAGGDVRATDVNMDDGLRPQFRLETPSGQATVALAVCGEHMVDNALAAAAAALAVGVGVDEIAAGLEEARLAPWRMEVTTLASGGVLINDAYNANPMSMAAGLRSLAAVDRLRRVAVLGEMAELGDRAAAEHAAIGSLARELGIEVIPVATAEYGLAPVADADAAVAALGPVDGDTAVLVKASRAVGLEAVAAALADG